MATNLAGRGTDIKIGQDLLHKMLELLNFTFKVAADSEHIEGRQGYSRRKGASGSGIVVLHEATADEKKQTLRNKNKNGTLVSYSVCTY